MAPEMIRGLRRRIQGIARVVQIGGARSDVFLGGGAGGDVLLAHRVFSIDLEPWNVELQENGHRKIRKWPSN
jgi:hypothetical protein